MALARRPLITRSVDRSDLPGPALTYRSFVPRTPGRSAPLVLLHGRGRAATRLFRAFLPAAVARDVALIVPTFPADRFAAYQRLAGADGPLAAAAALVAALDDVRDHFGITTDVVDLLGFSAGAQFAHRFAMVEPARVRRAVVVAAGWYTYLDEHRPFPTGVGGHVPVDVEGFLRVPVHVLVGERDVHRDAGLRTGSSLDRRQGPHRLARALRWMDHVDEVARVRGVPSRVSFDLLADCGHGLGDAVRRGGLVAHAAEFLDAAAPGGPS
ncbi:MAG: hypothetical protein ACT4RN_07550 [Pseudonocardia sp.]